MPKLNTIVPRHVIKLKLKVIFLCICCVCLCSYLSIFDLDRDILVLFTVLDGSKIYNSD